MLGVSTIMGEMPWDVFLVVLFLGSVTLWIWRGIAEDLLIKLLKFRKKGQS